MTANTEDETTEAQLDELPEADEVTTTVEEHDVEDAEEHDEKYTIHYNLDDSDAAIFETFTFYEEEDEYRIFHEFTAFAENGVLVEESSSHELNEGVDDVVTRDDDATPRNFVESWRLNADLQAIWEPATEGY